MSSSSEEEALNDDIERVTVILQDLGGLRVIYSASCGCRSIGGCECRTVSLCIHEDERAKGKVGKVEGYLKVAPARGCFWRRRSVCKPHTEDLKITIFNFRQSSCLSIKDKSTA